MSETFLFTSESVNEGHPDKLCDQVLASALVHIIVVASASCRFFWYGRRPPLQALKPVVSSASLAQLVLYTVTAHICRCLMLSWMHAWSRIPTHECAPCTLLYTAHLSATSSADIGFSIESERSNCRRSRAYGLFVAFYWSCALIAVTHCFLLHTSKSRLSKLANLNV